MHVAASSKKSVCPVSQYGFGFHPISLNRKAHSPLVELRTFLSILRLYRVVKPDIVHLVTIKPVLYGSIAARLMKVNNVVAAVSGLGTVFLADSFLKYIRRLFVVYLYKIGFAHRRCLVIFQNEDDKRLLENSGALQNCRSRLIRGSGVDLNMYSYIPEPSGVPVVTMVARLLRDKGVREFVDAARILKERGVSVTFVLAGAPDDGNPTSVDSSELEKWRQDGLVDLLGHCTDIQGLYSKSNIACLPSYREGLPKSLVEAAACGRAVVTTDVPGCRDAIVPDVTGVLVPPRDANALADAIHLLVESPEVRMAMGKAGRALAEEEFGIDRIVDQHMAIYKEFEEKL